MVGWTLHSSSESQRGKRVKFYDRSAESYLNILKRYLAEKGEKPDRALAFLCNPPYRGDDDQSADAISYKIDPDILKMIGPGGASDVMPVFSAMKLICESAKECGLQGIPYYSFHKGYVLTVETTSNKFDDQFLALLKI